jgi:Protein of unknown function (DUF2795)
VLHNAGMTEKTTFQLEHEITAALKGIHLPATGEEIVKKARDNGANQEVIKRLEQLRFHTVTDVVRAAN